MNCSPNYTEWSREEKEELAKRRMDEMRLKNEKLLQRYAEVENDRIQAESLNSAITGAAKTVKKEKNMNQVDCNKEVEHAREWDRGKPDKEHWKSPEHHGSSFKNYRPTGRNRRDNDRKDNWGSFSRNENGDRSRPNRGTDDPYEKRTADRKDAWSGYSRNDTTDHYNRPDHAPESRKLRGNYRYKQNDNQHGSSRPQVSPKRTRGVGYRNSDSHRKPPDDKFRRTDYNRSNSRKKYSYRAHSRSTSRSGSDHAENQFTIRAYNLWQNDKISEDQTKQNRVEKWVKSVNKTNMWGGKQFSPEQKDKNTNKFVHDKNTGKVPSEPKEKSTNRSFSKFDRYENNPNKSSEEELNVCRGNKSCENSQRDQIKGAAYVKQMGGLTKKGVQTKRSPQYSSGSSTRNENFRKQRRFDGKGQKNDYKPKMHDNDSWKNDNKTTLASKLDNLDSWNQEDDGLWGNADQSHIKWKISDEENDAQDKRETVQDIETKVIWNDKQITSDSKSLISKEKDQVPSNNDDGIWSNVEQSDIRWKGETESQDGPNQNWEYSNSSTALKEAKKDGWEPEQLNPSNIKEEKEELKGSDHKTYDSGLDEGNSRQQKSDCEEDMIVNSFKHSVFISEDKHLNVTVNYFPDKPITSDDGGWSTVSEDDDENKKLEL